MTSYTYHAENIQIATDAALFFAKSYLSTKYQVMMILLWIWAYSVEFMDGPMFYGISAVPSVLNTFWFAHLAC